MTQAPCVAPAREAALGRLTVPGVEDCPIVGDKLKPSEYFQRQMWATYIDDFVGVANRHFIGVDKMMWSSDYPHQASSWPHSQEVVARDFKDASPEERFKITRGNVAKLYGFEL